MVAPVRLLKNKFYKQVLDAETNCMPVNDLASLLGKGRAKKGMFEGDLDEGELEIGQVSALIKKIQPAAEIVSEIWNEYLTLSQHPQK